MRPVIHSSPATLTPVAGTPSNCTLGTPETQPKIDSKRERVRVYGKRIPPAKNVAATEVERSPEEYTGSTCECGTGVYWDNMQHL